MEILLIGLLVGLFLGAYLWKAGFRGSVNSALGKFINWLSNAEEKDVKK